MIELERGQVGAAAAEADRALQTHLLEPSSDKLGAALLPLRILGFNVGPPAILSASKPGALELAFKFFHGAPSALNLVNFGNRQLPGGVEPVENVFAGLEWVELAGGVSNAVAYKRLQD